MKIIITPPAGYGVDVIEPLSVLGERAYVLAMLAYPGAGDASKRARVALGLNDTVALGLGFGDRSASEDLLPVLGKSRSVLRWSDVLSNFKGRLEAGNLAVGLMLDEAGVRVKFPSDQVRTNHLTAMEWAAARASDDGQETPSDRGSAKSFEKRIWRRSLPVIHLAASYAYFMASNVKRQATFFDLADDEELFRQFIEFAAVLKPLGPRIRPRSIRAEALWDISPILWPWASGAYDGPLRPSAVSPTPANSRGAEEIQNDTPT